MTMRAPVQLEVSWIISAVGLSNFLPPQRIRICCKLWSEIYMERKSRCGISPWNMITYNARTAGCNLPKSLEIQSHQFKSWCWENFEMFRISHNTLIKITSTSFVKTCEVWDQYTNSFLSNTVGWRIFFSFCDCKNSLSWQLKWI